MLRFDCISLFPDILLGFVGCSMLRQVEEINLHNFWDWAKDKHYIKDDNTYDGYHCGVKTWANFQYYWKIKAS